MDKILIFLPWHYTKGLEIYVTNWFNSFDSIIQYFSLPFLIRTAFSPWKRLIDLEESPGFDLQKIFEKISFNLISRIIGAIVRISLFLAGLVLIFLTFLGGIFGLFAWFVLPFLSVPIYVRWSKDPVRYAQALLNQIQNSQSDPIEAIFVSKAGEFVLEHIGVDVKTILENAVRKEIAFGDLVVPNFEQIIRRLVDEKLWSDQFFREFGFTDKDLCLAASLWDKMREDESVVISQTEGRASVGLETMFGYTPNLNKYVEDLGINRSFSYRLVGREQEVSRMERSLNGGSGVVLVGQPGVGKKTVVLEFARRASIGQLGQKMAYRRILGFDLNTLLSESADINFKKALLTLVLKEVAYAGNIILMFRDFHRLINKDAEGVDFTDVFEMLLEKKNLQLIVITTPDEYEKYIVRNNRLKKYLETIEIKEPTKEEATLITLDVAVQLEKRKNMVITIPAIRKIMDESDNYLTETPFPEKALELLEAVVLYVEQIERKKTVLVGDVDKVMAEKTGISFTRLTDDEKKQLGSLEEIIHEGLINQEMAVNLIAKSLRARTISKDSRRPIGSFLFLGPTGVGKTETAKVLSRVYFGGEDKILRFDMADYAGKEGFERLVGSVDRNQPGTLTTAIKNRPASLLLLDEFEKSSNDIFNLFLRLLDEGQMTDAFGKLVIGRNLFLIGTSNAGAEYIRELVAQGIKGEDLQTSVIDYVLKERIFSPELLNRFDGVVVYEPLKEEYLLKIAKMLVTKFSKNLLEHNIYLEITDSLLEKIAHDGFDPAFGARPMSRIVNLTLGDLFGRAILKGEIVSGDVIRVLPGSGKEEFSLENLGKYNK
ncbi:ATP-dependent Clp protease ATP-binding subunit [Candidatus Woesebacteria bacterium]|nr:MAG: ATP-dependent Clp protease ATP-binding subunit [Candidatus Woesebacteria bacterium]